MLLFFSRTCKSILVVPVSKNRMCFWTIIQTSTQVSKVAAVLSIFVQAKYLVNINTTNLTFIHMEALFGIITSPVLDTVCLFFAVPILEALESYLISLHHRIRVMSYCSVSGQLNTWPTGTSSHCCVRTGTSKEMCKRELY